MTYVIYMTPCWPTVSWPVLSFPNTLQYIIPPDGASILK